MEYTRKENIAVIGIAILFLGALAAMSYLIWLQHGSLKRSANVTTSEFDCQNLSLEQSKTAQAKQYLVTIVNNSDLSCQLTGYPAIFIKDTHDIVLGAAIAQDYAPQTIHLASHGGKAYTTIQLPDAQATNKPVCTNGNTNNIELYVPGNEKPIMTSFNEPTCQGFTTTALRASEKQ